MAGEVACCGLIQTRSTKISRKFEPTLAVEAQTQTAYSRCRAPAPTTPSSAPVPTLLLPATEPCHHQVDITTAAVCVCRHAMYTAPRSQHPLALCRCAETRTHKQLHPCSWRDFRSHGYHNALADLECSSRSLRPHDERPHDGNGKGGSGEVVFE